MSDTQQKTATGSFVWYELMTTDSEAAKAFYTHVVGWRTRPLGPDYTLLDAGTKEVAGLMTLPKEARDHGAKPAWFGYIAVESVDDYVERVKKAGGFLLKEPMDIPNVGRFALVADPQHVPFMLFRGASDGGHNRAPEAGTPGYPSWHELHAKDGAAAFEFYSQLFGWVKTESMDMGPMGVYQMYGFVQGGPTMGGMMTDQENPSHWLYYFNVEGIDSAAARVTEKGGELIAKPHEVPGGSYIAVARDPQGAVFAIAGPKG